MTRSPLHIHGLSLSINRRRLLSDIELELEAGRVTVLIGPNGAGKSTLFRAIAGEMKHEGELRLFDRPRAQWHQRELARRLAVLPQQSGLMFPFLAHEVVAMGRIPHDTLNRENERIVEACMQQANVWHLKEAAYPRLSGGEKQRVHFARVLAQLAGGPGQQLLLLDEPTSALDLGQQHGLLREARQLAAAGTAVLVIVHDLNLAARYGDQLVLMHNGRISCTGTAKQVLTPERVEKHFGYRAQLLQSPDGHAVLV